MATAEAAAGPGPRLDHLTGAAREASLDRWIYVVTAAIFIAIVLAGFIPDSFKAVAAIKAAQRPPFPPAAHFHAVLMGTFLLLLLTQTVLMATERPALHRRLGWVGAGLACALIVAGFILAPTTYHSIWDAARSAPPAARPALQEAAHVFDNIVLAQLRIGFSFAILTAIAISVRNARPGAHKRLILLATALALPAAIDRMTWLPTTMPGSPLAADLYVLVALSPLLIWDVFRNRRLHGAYLVFLAVAGPFAAFEYMAWDTPWWHATVQQMMGVSPG